MEDIPERVERLFPWQIDSDIKWWSRPLKLGEIACSLSHLECWRIANENDGATLILEDDTCALGDFEIIGEKRMGLLYQIDPDWELVYFGRVSMSLDKEFICEGVRRPGYSHCTYAYAIRSSGAEKLVKSNILRVMMPVDDYLSAHCCEHPRADVRQVITRKLNAYAFQPEIITQLDKDKWGSDTENSEFI